MGAQNDADECSLTKKQQQQRQLLDGRQAALMAVFFFFLFKSFRFFIVSSITFFNGWGRSMSAVLWRVVGLWDVGVTTPYTPPPPPPPFTAATVIFGEATIFNTGTKKRRREGRKFAILLFSVSQLQLPCGEKGGGGVSSWLLTAALESARRFESPLRFLDKLFYCIS